MGGEGQLKVERKTDLKKDPKRAQAQLREELKQLHEVFGPESIVAMAFQKALSAVAKGADESEKQLRLDFDSALTEEFAQVNLLLVDTNAQLEASSQREEQGKQRETRMEQKVSVAESAASTAADKVAKLDELTIKPEGEEELKGTDALQRLAEMVTEGARTLKRLERSFGFVVRGMVNEAQAVLEGKDEEAKPEQEPEPQPEPGESKEPEEANLDDMWGDD